LNDFHSIGYSDWRHRIGVGATPAPIADAAKRLDYMDMRLVKQLEERDFVKSLCAIFRQG
jgi:hypothetical protein